MFLKTSVRSLTQGNCYFSMGVERIYL